MAKPKDDASTSIVEKVNAFISRLNSEMDSLVKSRKAEIDTAQKAKDPKSQVPLPKPVPAISFKLGPAADTAARTPFEQATQVAAGRSDVCRGDGDAFHLELALSKITKTDERAKACMEEYVKLTRVSSKPNNKFEKTYSRDLESFIIKDNTARHLDKRHLEP